MVWQCHDNFKLLSTDFMFNTTTTAYEKKQGNEGEEMEKIIFLYFFLDFLLEME